MDPILVLGRRSGNALLQVDEGYTDDGEDIEVLAESVPVAPAGVMRDALFDSLYFTVTWTMGVTLRITPILDGEEITDEASDLELTERFESDGDEMPRRSRTYVKRLNRDLFDGETRIGRVGMRGTWFGVKIESVGGIGRGALLVDAVSLEFDDDLSETREEIE